MMRLMISWGMSVNLLAFDRIDAREGRDSPRPPVRKNQALVSLSPFEEDISDTCGDTDEEK